MLHFFANLQTLSILKPVLDAKGVAEDALRDSGIAYTILRPGGLMPPVSYFAHVIQTEEH
jgi:uncharacterized protein YbjT (DUF2867 family)